MHYGDGMSTTSTALRQRLADRPAHFGTMNAVRTEARAAIAAECPRTSAALAYYRVDVSTGELLDRLEAIENGTNDAWLDQ